MKKGISHITKSYLSAVLILCLGFVVYSNTFHCPFELDDNASIVDNFFITRLSDLESIWAFWPGRFMTYLSLAFNYHFGGLNVFGYHVFNLLVHIGAGILVWRLMLLILSTPSMKGQKITNHSEILALLAGLVFVVHPVQTEAVTYIVQRAASLASLFYLASLCLYFKARLTGSKTYYCGAWTAAVLAMFSKEMAVTLPLMALLCEFSFFDHGDGNRWKSCAPFLLTLLVIPLTMFLTKTVDFHEMRRIQEPAAGITPLHYLLTQFRVMVTYLRLLALPFHQHIHYDYPLFMHLWTGPVMGSLLLLGVVLFYAQRLFLKYRLVSFSIFWFFLALLPESSLIPIKDVIAEHRLYLPLAGYSIFLVAGGYYLLGKKSIKWTEFALVAVIGCYSVLTYQRNIVWSDEFALWNDVIKDFPYDARAYNGRGTGLFRESKFDAAVSDYDRAIEINPDYADAYFNRGIIFYNQGRLDQAAHDFDKSIRLNPGFNSEAYNNRGIVYARKADFLLAKSDFMEAIRINPGSSQAYCNLGNVFYKQGDNAKALINYDKAVAIDPHACPNALVQIAQ